MRRSRWTSLSAALLLLPLAGATVVGCGTTGPVEVGSQQFGGDASPSATIDTKLWKLHGVDRGDTLMFYPGAGKQEVEPANTVTFRYYEQRKLDSNSIRGVNRLIISQAVALAGDDDYRENHLIDVGRVEPGKPIRGSLRFTVTNAGTEIVPTFLIVDLLPEGFEIPHDGQLKVTADESQAEWEVDAEGRLLIRDEKPIRPASSRTYTLPLDINVRTGR
ncbi:MAG: hypothetical protein AB7K09_05475 [Planctomycetota bacterium]